MTLKKAIFLIFFISAKLLCGQDSIDNRICIKLAPLAILDIYSGMSPRMGIEYKLKNNYALYNEIGTYIPYVNGMHNNKGIIGKLEFKWYVNHNGLSWGPYLSAEFLYKQQSYGTYDSILIKPNYTKDYNVSKNVCCFTIKAGFMNIVKSHLVADMFIGLGLRYRQIRSTLTIEENDHIQSSGDYSINIAKNQAGNWFSPNIDIGVKIGYRVK